MKNGRERNQNDSFSFLKGSMLRIILATVFVASAPSESVPFKNGADGVDSQYSQYSQHSNWLH